AEAEFAALTDAGMPRAAAALAEIAAFRGRWASVLDNVGKALGALKDIETFNVQADLVALAARAARETANWDELARIAELGRGKLGKGGDPDLSRMLAGLADLAAGKGVGGPD